MIALAVFAAIGWGASDFLGGISRGRALVFSVLVVSELIGAVMILPALAVTGAPRWDGHLLLAGVAGICVTVELGVVYYALSVGAAFITAPVGALGAALAVTAGLIGGDRLTAVIGVGLICAIIGGGLSSGGGEDHGELDLGRSIGACLLAASAVAAMQITLHTAGKASPYWAAELEHLATALTAGLLVTAVWIRRRRRPVADRRDPIWPARRQLPLLVLVALTGAGGDVSYAAASTGMLSTVSAIASLYPIPTIALAAIVQHHRPNRAQSLGMVLALTGAAILGAAS